MVGFELPNTLQCFKVTWQQFISGVFVNIEQECKLLASKIVCSCTNVEIQL
jgi:hypothetical protein